MVTDHGNLYRAFVIAVGTTLMMNSVGCSSKMKIHPVSGQVTYRGKSISKGAMIRFYNEKTGIDMTAPLDENGHFEINMAEGMGLPAGEYAVAVVPPFYTLTPEFIEKHRDKSPHLAKFPDIPERYRETKTSGVIFHVPEDGPVFQLDMVP